MRFSTYQQFRKACEECSGGFDDDMAETLYRYLINGIPPGSFTLSVLEGDLFGAYARADHYWSEHLRELVVVIQNLFPISAYGSRDRAAEWMRRRQDERYEREEKYRERERDSHSDPEPEDNCAFTAIEDVPGFGGRSD